MAAKIQKFFESLNFKTQSILIICFILLTIAIVEKPSNLILLVNILILFFLYYLLFEFVKYLYRKIKNK